MALTKTQLDGLVACQNAARAAGHPWPGIAAAEAAVESATLAGGWFTSTNYTKHCNALGIKPWATYEGAVFTVPTNEFLPKGAQMPSDWKNARDARPAVKAGRSGLMWRIDAEFVHFASLTGCFQAQLRILRGARYFEAMRAATAEDFARLVSAVWATDPSRGQMVQAIYASHRDVLGVAYA